MGSSPWRGLRRLVAEPQSCNSRVVDPSADELTSGAINYGRLLSMSIAGSYRRGLKKIFICFDYDNDRSYRYLLAALKQNSRSGIEFEDLTPEEIQSDDVGQVKAGLTRRIRKSDYTLVIIGKHANASTSVPGHMPPVRRL
jgi:hypothetical protein